MVRAAMILAAGKGTRLRPLSEWVAKPLVPVGDRTAIDGIADAVRRGLGGDAAIVVNAHHRARDVASWARDAGVQVSCEDELLGTAGGVAFASSLLGDGDVLVWNGDIVSELDARALAGEHEQGYEAEATLAVVSRPRGEGNVGLRDGRVVRLRDQRFEDSETEGADFAGIQVLGARLRRELPARGCLVGDVYIPALRRGAHIGALRIAPFIDVGSISGYREANRAWLLARGLASWAAKDAQVDASIDGSVVGRSAVVRAAVVRSIVWPGARVDQPIRDAIVTPFGVVAS